MPQKPKVHICKGEACTNAGTQSQVHEWLLKYFSEDEIETCPCLGLCHDNFAIRYKGKAYSIFTEKGLQRIIKASSSS